MITLQEIFDTLSTGEFANMKIGNSLQGTIEAADYPKIVNAINLGLLDLHKKFPLRKNEFKVHQHADVTQYILREEHAAILDELDNYYYIELGDDEDWPADLIKVNSLWETDGTEISLNDATDRNTDGVLQGGFTPSFDILKMTPRAAPITVHVEYRARYPKIIITETFDPEKVELDIPDFIEEPLLFFVASRVFRGIASKANEGEVTSAFTYHTLYRTACLDITQSGLVTTDNDSNEQFDNNGWV